MAERRMFSQKIVESDAFYDMPADSQALYMHLCMNADDDGFVNNSQKIRRAMGCSEDSLKILLAKRFVLPFESGVVVVKHWRMQNSLRKDRYKPTEYTDEKSLLYLKPNGSYTFDESQGVNLLSVSPEETVQEGPENDVATNGCQTVAKRLPQYSIDKSSIDKSSIEEGSIGKGKRVLGGKENNKKNNTRACARDEGLTVEKFEQLAECEGWEKYPNGEVYREVRDAAFKLIDDGKLFISDISQDLISQILASMYCGRERRQIVDLPNYILAIIKRLRKNNLGG